MKKITIIVFAILATSNLHSSIRRKIEKNKPKVERRIRYTSSDLDSELRKIIFSKIDPDNEESLANYKEFFKLVDVIKLKDGQIIYGVNYKDGEYENVGSEFVNDDQFLARILWPSKRNSEEYGNWFKFIASPRVNFILAKSFPLSRTFGDTCSWDELLFMLKRCRPGITKLQIEGLRERPYLLQNPAPLISETKLKFNNAQYINLMSIRCFLATVGKPFTRHNMEMATALVSGVAIAAATTYATEIARNKAYKPVEN